MKYNSTHIRNSLLIDPDNLSKDAQVGIDLTIKKVFKIEGGAFIGDKTTQGISRELPLVAGSIPNEGDKLCWEFMPGVYEITFDQGIKKLSSTENASIIQRSSLNRNGCQVRGSVYDPGFFCDNLGATLKVDVPITIMEHARVAQLVVETNEAVEEEKTYNGQYQGK